MARLKCSGGWGFLLLVASVTAQAGAAPAPPRVYAFCVEAGVPGVTPRPAPEMARLLRDVGFDGAGYSNLTDPHLDDVLRAYDRAGLAVYLVETTIDLRPSARSHVDPAILSAIGKLKGRPATVVVRLEGLKAGDPAGIDPAVRALRELGDVAARTGVRVSIYNHADTWAERVEFCVEVVRKVDRPQVGFNFNLCHWLKVETDHDYRPLLRANADRLFCVTICGARVGSQTWTDGLIQPLDRGDFDNRALLATLHEVGYEGPVGIMCYGIPGDPRDYLRRSLETWRNWTRRP